MTRSTAVAAAVLFAFGPIPFRSSGDEIVVGNIRIQTLADDLVRIEQRGPAGFEDRETFLVVERAWPGAPATTARDDDGVTVSTARYGVRVPAGADGIEGIEVIDDEGLVIYTVGPDLPSRPRFPAPADLGAVFAMGDSPRVIPPAWGATPVPEGALADDDPLAATSGWDLGNDAPDLYVFLPGDDGYTGLRRSVLRLTGPIPLPPRFVLGFWDSRYHPYTDDEAIEVIRRYRRSDIPLDVFVVDTNWRVGASHGYEVSTEHFPDMPAFLARAHAEGVRVMFNDHPQLHGAGPFDPEELRFRWDGLTGHLESGLDFWWYDKNWPGIITGPVDGIDREVWGQRVFIDTHHRLRPTERPLLMSMRSGHPASHRYPIWWTGDIHSTFNALRDAVRDSVADGIALLPWVHQDLGGHTGNPSIELYVRFLQWGCLSPVARVHCTSGRIRYPWAFGENAETIVRDYVKLRYRLLPTLYAAARRSYDDGTPVLRRCDLAWPDQPAARDDYQYLLGDDLLVAPIVEGRASGDPIPDRYVTTPDGEPGVRAEYFANPTLEGDPALVRTEPLPSASWGFDSPAPGIPNDDFSVRLTFRIGPVDEPGDYELILDSDDGVRLWFDDESVVDQWHDHALRTDRRTVRLERDRVYPVRVEFYEHRNEAICLLRWHRPRATDTAVRTLWLPPGRWEDAWTGAGFDGPAEITAQSPLWHTPIFVRRGGLVLSTPQTHRTDQAPWTRVVADAWPEPDVTTERELYEDDGVSLAYADGDFARTAVRCSRTDEEILFEIDPVEGGFSDLPAQRAWLLRVHLEPGEVPGAATVDGITDPARIRSRVLAPAETPSPDTRLTMPFSGAGTRPGPAAGPVVEIQLPPTPVTSARAATIQLTAAP